MFDSHCHLDFSAYDADRDEVWRAARRAGVDDLLVPAYAPDGWARLARLGRWTGVHVALGVHPWAVASIDDQTLQAVLIALPGQARAVGARAIGECGLDAPLARRPGGVPLDRQAKVLTAQLRVARDLELPAVLHIVGAHGRAISLLEAEGPLSAGGVVHSYSGPAELVPRYAALNLRFSFAGAVTRPGARRPLAAARAVPAERLMVESDGPDQAPHGAPSKRSEPAYLSLVCRALARARGESEAEVAQKTADNARALFTL